MRIEKGRICVYTHAIEGVVFYVGKGVSYRPFESTRRSKAWDAMVAESGGIFDVDILAWFVTDKEARAWEEEEIKSRKPAANLMNNGWKRPESFRKFISHIHTGKVVSTGTRRKISAAARGREPWNRGVTPSAEQIDKLRASASKRSVVDISTGKVYESIHEAARSLEIRKEGIVSNLAGRQKTVGGRSFRYA